MKFNPVETLGDTELPPMDSIADYWRHWYRLWRIVKKCEDELCPLGKEISIAMRILWPPHTIEGYWLRMMNNQSWVTEKDWKIKLTIRLWSFKQGHGRAAKRKAGR